jgi:hypothetical protein
MALEAFEIGVLGVHQFVRDSTVGIVAIRTRHFPFPYGMMGLSQQLGFYPFMTLGAHLGLSGF